MKVFNLETCVGIVVLALAGCLVIPIILLCVMGFMETQAIVELKKRCLEDRQYCNLNIKGLANENH